MTVQPSRRVAYEVLEAVRRRDAYAPPILAAALEKARLSERDAALATRLTYGTLQALGSLDHAIDHWAKAPSRIAPQIRDILRVATWELLFGEGTPHAAVNDAVDAVRERSSHAVGFSNAVLRRIAGDPTGFPWDDTLRPHARDALLNGHPEWLVERWADELGPEDAASVLAADNTAAGIYVRINPFAEDTEGAASQLTAAGAGPAGCPLPGCLRVASASETVRSRLLADGDIVVQDAASQLATVVVDAGPDDVVIEVGSGAGTKSLGIQSIALAKGGPATVFAVDISERKIEVATRRLAELGVPGVVGVVGDATDLAAIEELPERPDVVFIDAPCSGLGTLRRHPMKRWRVTPGDIERLALLQVDLIQAAAAVTAPGGAIVYATCTILQAENGDVVRGFLDSAAGRDFRTVPLHDLVPREWHHWLTAEGWFQSLPTRDGPDGHFVARLERV